MQEAAQFLHHPLPVFRRDGLKTGHYSKRQPNQKLVSAHAVLLAYILNSPRYTLSQPPHFYDIVFRILSLTLQPKFNLTTHLNSCLVVGILFLFALDNLQPHLEHFDVCAQHIML